MDVTDIPHNSMILRMDILESGDLKIYTAYRFNDELTDEQCEYLQGLLEGLNYFLNVGTDFAVALGHMVNKLDEFEGEEIIFEPDDDLKQAVADAKVIPINKNKLN